MSRLPPALLYLAIYNPTLKPSGPIADDDEDAEEQAHILFYTSRERAVSRDKMLRQVGLAKALVNFSEYAAPPLILQSHSINLLKTKTKMKTIGGNVGCSLPRIHATIYIHNRDACSWSPQNPDFGSML
jgi:hypothetical protein